MVRFSRKLFLELASIGFACFALAIGLLWWRLEHGPADAGFLRPFVEAKFLQETGLHLSIDSLDFGAEGAGSPIEVEMRTLTVTDDAGTVVATLPQVAGSFAFRALIAGEIKPIKVTLTKPQISIIHKADGSFSPALPSSGEPEESGPDLQDIVKPPRDSDLEFWDKVSIEEGNVVLKEDGGAVIGHLDHVNLHVKRTPLGLEGVLQGSSTIGDTTGDFAGAVDCNVGARGSIEFHSAPIRPDTLAVLYKPLAAIQVPAAIKVSSILNGTSIDNAQLDIEFQPGHIVDPDHYSQPLRVSGGSLQALYNAKPERLELRKFELALDGPVLTATGEAHTNDGVVSLTSDIIVVNMPLDSFSTFWPQGIVAGGRFWVTSNLSKGLVTKATAHLAGSGPRATPEAIDISSADGTIAVTGATIHYFGELPSVQDASASIVYDMNSMTITMLGGHAGDLSLAGGTIILDGFEKPQQTTTIDIDLTGSVTSALDILDHKPLNYAHKLQLDPQAITGAAETLLHMQLPLEASLSVDRIDLTAKSTLKDVAIPNTVGHLAANALNGGMSVGTGGLEFIGVGQLGDIPLSLDYKQSFAPDGAIDVTFQGNVDNRQRGELGLDFPDRLKGTVGLSGHYASASHKGEADLNVDLTPAEFDIDEIGYLKPPGQGGDAKFAIKLVDGKITDIDPLTVEGPALAVQGAAHFDPDTSKLISLSLDKLQSDATDMKVAVSPLAEGGSTIDVTGPEFDARRFLHKRREKGAIAKEEASLEKPSQLVINVALDKVKTSDTAGLTGLKGQLVLLGRKWRRADFTASANGTAVSLSYQPDTQDADPSYTLHAEAADAGATFAGFALTDSIKGGTFSVDGKKPAATEQQPDPVLAGTLALTDFRVTNPPVFARLFNLLSVTGFSQSMDSSDIQFESLKGNFGIDNAQLRISDGKLIGSGIGLTISGTVDRDQDTLDLHGTAVPAYGANRIINRIPLLGPLITGGEGQGFIAATYSISGPFEKPDVSLNPLSVFAPGVLRDLFFSRSDPDTGVTEPVQK